MKGKSVNRPSSILTVRRAPFALLLIVLASCSPPPPKSVPAVVQTKASDVGWVLTNNDPNKGGPALLWNGLIGVRISRNANGLGYDGKPLSFLMIDQYSPNGEEKIIPMPNPLLVTWAVGNELFTPQSKADHDFLKSGGTPLDARNGTGYSQSLDMRTGVLRTHWTQKTPSGTVDLTCDTVVHPTERVLAQRWTVTIDKSTPFSIRTLDYTGPTDDQDPVGSDKDHGVFLTASKSRVVALSTKLTGADVGALSTVAGFRIQEGTALPGKPVTFERVLSFGPHSPKPLPHFDPKNIAAMKSVTPAVFGFDDVQKAAADSWTKKWKTDIEIDGPVEDQEAVRSFLFYLRSAVNPHAGMGISPFGLSDPRYNGHVFWDADIWVFPALALLDPEAAAAISSYRLSKARQAATNFGKWFEAGRPTGLGSRPITTSKSNPIPPGIKFPWESSVSGKETCLSSAVHEDHVTGSVLWSLTQAFELGLVKGKIVNEASALGANFYLSLADRTPAGLSISGVMGPDETGYGKNDLYTSLLGQWLANGRHWTTTPGSRFVLPKDDKSFLTYDGDTVKGYQQASAILSIYPLQYPPAVAEAKVMMDRFPPQVSKYGPAMSDSLNALIWARMGDPRAYETWQKGWKELAADPLLLYSEKRNPTVSYFTTGAAGSLQTVLYGFLGFGIDWDHSPGGPWSKKLVGASLLSIRPNLPPKWKSVKLKNFTVLGSSFTVTATPAACTVTPGE